jgi:hypothetical protein
MRRTHADPVIFFYTPNVALYCPAVESAKESTRLLAHWFPHRTSLRYGCRVLMDESGDCTLWTDGGNSVLILLLAETVVLPVVPVTACSRNSR